MYFILRAQEINNSLVVFGPLTKGQLIEEIDDNPTVEYTNSMEEIDVDCFAIIRGEFVTPISKKISNKYEIC